MGVGTGDFFTLLPAIYFFKAVKRLSRVPDYTSLLTGSTFARYSSPIIICHAVKLKEKNRAFLILSCVQSKDVKERLAVVDELCALGDKGKEFMYDIFRAQRMKVLIMQANPRDIEDLAPAEAIMQSLKRTPELQKSRISKAALTSIVCPEFEEIIY